MFVESASEVFVHNFKAEHWKDQNDWPKSEADNNSPAQLRKKIKRKKTELLISQYFDKSILEVSTLKKKVLGKQSNRMNWFAET